MRRRTQPSRLRGVRRRDFIRGSAIVLGASSARKGPAVAQTDGINVSEIRTISQSPSYYHGWPTVARRRSGGLVLVY